MEGRIQLKPVVYLHLFYSLSQVKSDQTCPALGELKLCLFFLHAKCQNNAQMMILRVWKPLIG